MFICRQKIKFTPYAFLEILQRYANFLFWVLWACLVVYTQTDRINLQKTSMLICMPKINFMIYFFPEIFKNPTIWLADSILTHNSSSGIFPDIRWGSNINNNNCFNFRLFLRKTNDKIFQKIEKKNYFGANLDLFCPNLDKNKFSWKKVYVSF